MLLESKSCYNLYATDDVRLNKRAWRPERTFAFFSRTTRDTTVVPRVHIVRYSQNQVNAPLVDGINNQRGAEPSEAKLIGLCECEPGLFVHLAIFDCLTWMT